MAIVGLTTIFRRIKLNTCTSSKEEIIVGVENMIIQSGVGRKSRGGNFMLNRYLFSIFAYFIFNFLECDTSSY